MKYIEIQTQTPKQAIRLPEYLRIAPTFLVRWTMKRNLANLRVYMGGSPRKDITTTKIDITDYTVQTAQLRKYTPQNANNGVLVFFHGGSFIGGSIDAVEFFCKAFAEKTQMNVIAVSYRYAPEHPFPDGVNDCYRAVNWIFDNADTLNIDKNDITVGGDSAGGNMAAAVTLMARDNNSAFKLAGQILLYPYVSFTFFPSTKAERVMREWYLKGQDASNPYASPYVADLSGLPRALVVVGQNDTLAMGGQLYAQKLSNCGTDSTLAYFKDTPHAFIDRIGVLKQAEELIDLIIKWKDNKLDCEDS